MSHSRFLAAGLLVATAACAQDKVAATINVDKPINVMTVESMGVLTDMYDSGITKPVVAARLHAAGMYTLVFPGGYGAYPDLYHWTQNWGTKYLNMKPEEEHFYAGENSMGHLAQFLDQGLTAVLVVNYGSNMAGTGGGEPAEAAAWVAYANGDPFSTRPLGKDSTGQDWHTVGYWASLRASAPLDNDDGLNKLRANHPKPLNIKLWQVGSEVYYNGYYNYPPGTKLEEDLHAPYPEKFDDNGKRMHNPNLSGKSYGEHVVEFSKAMKAVDPTIWVGATLNLPPNDYGWGADWDPDVLKAACDAIDFESMVWRPGDTIGPDYKTRDDGSVLRAPEEQLGKILSEVIYNNKKYCAVGHAPRLAMTQMAPIHWAKIPLPIVDTLFAADAFALLAESGVITSDWNELHDPTFLINDATHDNIPGPGYYGAQMVHIIAFRPGDKFVSAAANDPNIAVHATYRTDGALGVMIVNKNSKGTADVKVTVEGGKFATTGSRFDYGQETLKAAGQVAKTAFKADSNVFTVNVPADTVTDIVLPKAQ